jgi:GTPase SAR1 family protein
MQKPFEPTPYLKKNQAGMQARLMTEQVKSSIRMLEQQLADTPLWQPREALLALSRDVSQSLDGIEERLDHKLVVTLIGPTGAGKSTLLNALAGVDDLSTVGHQRPTTRSLVVLCNNRADTAQLMDEIGTENLQIHTNTRAAALENLILIDTPDTDSMEQARHMPMIQQAIALSDVLICIFDAENPKRMDHVDFMGDYVSRFDGDSIGVVLNKCDRLDETELRRKIVPEFIDYLAGAWKIPVDSVLCVSARRNLHQPEWDEGARPKHDFDQFYRLREIVFGMLDHGASAVDRRLANAVSLRDYLFQVVQSSVAQDEPLLRAAAEDMQAVENKALRNAVSALAADDRKQAVGWNVLLYQRLAQRWMGPVGWMVALWSRMLIFGSGLAAVFRFGRPLRQVVGMVSSLRRAKESRRATDGTTRGENLDQAMGSYRRTLMEEWPHIAGNLVKARFDPAVRQLEHALPEKESLTRELAALWGEALDTVMERMATNLSHTLLQLVFNLPALAILVLAGWRTAKGFVWGNYLSTDFFLHAVMAIGIIMLLSFFVLQVIFRWAAGPESLARQTLTEVGRRVEIFRSYPLNSISSQVEIILELSDADSRNNTENTESPETPPKF